MSCLGVTGDESVADWRQVGAPTRDDMVIAEWVEDMVVLGDGTLACAGERGDSGVGAGGE